MTQNNLTNKNEKLPNTDRYQHQIRYQNRKFKNYLCNCCQFWKQGQQPGCIAKYLQIDNLAYPKQHQQTKYQCICYKCGQCCKWREFQCLIICKYCCPFNNQHYIEGHRVCNLCWHCPCYQGMYCKGLDLMLKQKPLCCICNKCYENVKNKSCYDCCCHLCYSGNESSNCKDINLDFCLSCLLPCFFHNHCTSWVINNIINIGCIICVYFCWIY